MASRNDGSSEAPVNALHLVIRNQVIDFGYMWDARKVVWLDFQFALKVKLDNGLESEWTPIENSVYDLRQVYTDNRTLVFDFSTHPQQIPGHNVITVPGWEGRITHFKIAMCQSVTNKRCDRFNQQVSVQRWIGYYVYPWVRAAAVRTRWFEWHNTPDGYPDTLSHQWQLNDWNLYLRPSLSWDIDE